MKRKAIGVVASLALAVLGTFLVLSYVRSADDRAQAGEERVEVLVVTHTVAAGEPASSVAAKVEPTLVPQRVRAEHALATMQDVEGMVAAVDLQQGEQLLATRFVTEEIFAEDVAVEVPEGLLQVTVSLSPERAVGGQLAPGDLVAFVASFDPFQFGAVEPTDLDVQVIFAGGGTDPDAEEEGASAPDKTLQTPNSSHIVLHKALVTAVQIERLPAETDLQDAEAVGLELAPTGNLLITLALPAPDVEKVVFSAEHGSVWLAHEPEGASEVGTLIQTRGTIYR